MPVVSHSQKRKKWLGIGCRSRGSMGLVAVQVDRDRCDGDMSHAQRHQHIAHQGKSEETGHHAYLIP